MDNMCETGCGRKKHIGNKFLCEHCCSNVWDGHQPLEEFCAAERVRNGKVMKSSPTWTNPDGSISSLCNVCLPNCRGKVVDGYCETHSDCRAKNAKLAAPKTFVGLTALAGIARGETWEHKAPFEKTWHQAEITVSSASLFVNPNVCWRRAPEKHVHTWQFPIERDLEIQRVCSCGARQRAEWKDVDPVK